MSSDNKNIKLVYHEELTNNQNFNILCNNVHLFDDSITVNGEKKTK